MPSAPAPHDFEGWVAQLGNARRRHDAKLHLRSSGSAALPALRRGLRHRKPMVRRMCASILDQLVDEASIPALVRALDDPDPDVLRRALHALACDQCKENECRPDDDAWLPRALEFVRTHDNADVRAGAIDALGRRAGQRPDVVDVLIVAAERDAHPGVRNAARMRLRRIAPL